MVIASRDALLIAIFLSNLSWMFWASTHLMKHHKDGDRGLLIGIAMAVLFMIYLVWSLGIA